MQVLDCFGTLKSLASWLRSWLEGAILVKKVNQRKFSLVFSLIGVLKNPKIPIKCVETLISFGTNVQKTPATHWDREDVPCVLRRTTSSECLFGVSNLTGRILQIWKNWTPKFVKLFIKFVYAKSIGISDCLDEPRCAQLFICQRHECPKSCSLLALDICRWVKSEIKTQK